MKTSTQLLTISFILISTSYMVLTHALPSDKNQPMHIQADHVDVDYNHGINTFHGHAIMTQGSSELTGETITTYNDNAHHVKKVVAIGDTHTQASYTTTQNPGDPVFHSWADSITYITLTETATLDGHARAIHGKDHFKGPNITYNKKTEVITTAPSEEGQATIILRTG